MAVAGGAPPATNLTEAAGSRFIGAGYRSVRVAGTTCRKASYTLGCKPPEALRGLWDSQGSAWFGPDTGNSRGPGTHHGSGLIQRNAKVDALSAFLHQRLPGEEEAASESLANEVTEQFPPTSRFDQFERTAMATPVRGSR